MNRKEFFNYSFAALASIFAPKLSFAASGVVSSNQEDKLSKKEKIKLEEMTALRHKARWRHRRVIYSNDGNDIQSSPKEVISPGLFLSKRVTAILGTHVDTYCYCTGITFGGSHRSGKDRLAEKHHGMDRTVAEMEKMGMDPLQLVVDFCHQHGIEAFWSHRMNDNHDHSPSQKALLSNFKLAHPEYLIGYTLKDIDPKQATCFDYSIPQVRDKAVESCKVVVDNYDVDGIELDYFRHLTLFKSTVLGGVASNEEREMMNDMMRKIRAVLDRASIKRGHPILLSVRVPDSIGFSKAIGIDYDQWVKEDLIDLIIANDYLKFEPWRNIAQYGLEHNIPVYASLESRRLHLMPGSDPNSPEDDKKLWMSEAYAAWLSGVSGIHAFNVFDPCDPVLSLIGDPRILAKAGAEPRESFGNDKRGYCDPRYWLKSGRKYMRIPDSIEYRKPLKYLKWPNSDVERD